MIDDPFRRFRIASGAPVAAKEGGTYRDITVIDNPWMAEMRRRDEEREREENKALLFDEDEQAQLSRAPHAVRVGEMEFSTSTALVSWPYVCWDVNHYYLELGVSWRATNAELRQAYIDRNGQESDRLTYIVKQLLDPEARRQYDGCRFGTIFFDRYVAEEVREKARQEQRAAAGGLTLDSEQMDEAGFEQLDLSGQMNSEIDLDGRHSPVVGSAWKWGFYLWKTGNYDLDRLAVWQQSLTVAFGHSPRRLSVGLMGGDTEAQVITVGEHTVAFININTEPTPILARTLFTTSTE